MYTFKYFETLKLQDDQQHWQIVFWLAGGGYFLGNIIYVIFASGEVQPWNDVSNINAQEHAAEIEREANSFQNRRTRGTNILLKFQLLY